MNSGALAGACYDLGGFVADGLAKSNVRHQSVTEEGVHAMPGAIDELIGNHEIQRLVLLLQRTHRRQRKNALHPELLESVNIGAIRKLGGHQTMSAPMTGEERDLAATQCAQNVRIGRRSKWRLQRHFVHIGQAGHGVQTTPADNPNFRLLQRVLLQGGEQTLDYTKRKGAADRKSVV